MIKKEYVNEFQNRLNHRSIDTDFKSIESNINKLFELCMQLRKGKQTPQYSDDEIMKAIKQLKRNRSQDPKMLKAELFLDSGSSFRLSIGLMFNKIKQEKRYPQNGIKSLFLFFNKRKGNRKKLGNYRGIILTVIMAKSFERIL